MFTMVAIVGLKVNGGRRTRSYGVPVHRPAAGASAPAPEHALLQATGRADASRTSHPQRTTTHNLMHTRTTDTLLRDSSRADYLLID